MNIQYWIDRLQRDAKRQRGKTLVLGAISLLAVGLWWSALTGGAESPAAAAQPAAASPVTAANPRYWKRWKTWKESLDSESLQPLRHDQQKVPDPFAKRAPAKKDKAKEPEKKPVKEKLPPPDTPQKEGLRLESTLSLHEDGAAGINGAVFRMGQPIVIDNKPTGYRLIDVAARHVTIERNGHTFTLELPDRLGASVAGGR